MLYIGDDGEKAMSELQAAGSAGTIIEGGIIRNPDFTRRLNFEHLRTPSAEVDPNAPPAVEVAAQAPADPKKKSK